jgi:phospholipid/cholesterol/gamma-HCH transport system substrate-binding protein
MRNRARLAWAIATISSSLAMASCASLNVAALPAPGSQLQGGYDIVVEFANVLNLPDRAKVVMDGTKVGEVTKVTLTESGVDVTSHIDHAIVVPSNIHAVMQQATVLGDTYVAFERTPNAAPAPPLGPGGRIPLAQTTSPPQLEDTIASMANFIGSGSIQRAQDTIIKINNVTPPRPEARKIAARAAADLSDLSNNIDNVDLWLKGLSESATVMYTSTPSLKFWFSPEGVTAFRHNFVFTHYLAPILPTIGTVYYNGYWLVPALTSSTDALEAITHSKWAFDEEVPRWRHLVTDYLLPERKHPAINITSIVGPDGRDLSGNVEQVLRMIGAMP